MHVGSRWSRAVRVGVEVVRSGLCMDERVRYSSCGTLWVAGPCVYRVGWRSGRAVAGDLNGDLNGDLRGDLPGDLPGGLAGDLPGDSAGDRPAIWLASCLVSWPAMLLGTRHALLLVSAFPMRILS